ncbi:MAG: hypothetical protein ACPL3A_06865 [Thermoanaerobacteraceae bacterium]
MGIISTSEIENKIRNGYSRLRARAEKNNIYMELNVLFSNNLPLNFEGVYAYSDNVGYHYVSIEKGVMNR